MDAELYISVCFDGPQVEYVGTIATSTGFGASGHAGCPITAHTCTTPSHLSSHPLGDRTASTARRASGDGGASSSASATGTAAVWVVWFRKEKKSTISWRAGTQRTAAFPPAFAPSRIAFRHQTRSFSADCVAKNRYFLRAGTSDGATSSALKVGKDIFPRNSFEIYLQTVEYMGSDPWSAHDRKNVQSLELLITDALKFGEESGPWRRLRELMEEASAGDTPEEIIKARWIG